MKRDSSASPGLPSTSTARSDNSSEQEEQMAHEKTQKRLGKRPGRKPSKIDQKAKLERSRQSARECRARKKLRYQYLEELVASREKAVFSLREELDLYKRWAMELDRGVLSDSLLKVLAIEEMEASAAPGWQQSSPLSQDSTTPVSSPAGSDVTRQQQYGSQQHVQQSTSQQQQHAGHYSQQASFSRSQQGQYSPPQGHNYSPQQGHNYSPQQGHYSPQQQGHYSPQQQGYSPQGHYVGGQGHFQGHVRRQGEGSLVRQPSVKSQPDTLAAMHKESRSMEEMSSSPSSSSSSVFRAGSVPNLCAESSVAPPRAGPSGAAPFVFRDFDHHDTSSSLYSTGFTTQLIGSLTGGESSMDAHHGNIPTVVSQHSPPASRPNVQRHSTWPWSSGSPHQHTPDSQPAYNQRTSDSRFMYPAAGSSRTATMSSSQSFESGARVQRHPSNASSVFSSNSPQSNPMPSANSPHSASGLSPKSVHSSHSPPLTLLGTSETVHPDNRLLLEKVLVRATETANRLRPETVSTNPAVATLAGQQAIPFYQRPRSSSDLARNVTSTVTSQTMSSSQENLRGLLLNQSDRTLNVNRQGAATVQNVNRQGVATCLNLQAMNTQGVRVPTCTSSAELSASISEPLPLWYSFLDDLESASTTSRRGAHSSSGTPSSSRTRSRPDTPLSGSTDSPSSQSQQQSDSGNIPHIITDYMGQRK